MIKTVYLVRHAEPNFNNHDDFSRELTQKGLQDCQLLIDYFVDKPIDTIYSSPYKRALDTITPLSINRQLFVNLAEDFRERKITDSWIEDFKSYAQRQWSDFSYKLPNGESLQDVQDRTTKQLNDLLTDDTIVNLVVSSHGTAISTLLNHYSPFFGYDQFDQIKGLMPFVARLVFNGRAIQSVSLDNIFTGETHEYLTL